MTRCLPQTHRAYPKCTAAFHNCTVVCPNAGLHPSMTAQRPSQQPRSRGHRALHHHAAPYPLPPTCQTLGFMVQAAFLLVAACWLCACFSTVPPSARRERAESHQWTRAAVAFPASARSLYKPARTERRSLWMSPPSHKALRASTTTAPPNTKSPVPRPSDEQVVTLVDSRPPMRPLAPSPLAPGSQPCPRRTAARHTIDPPRMTRPGEGFLPRAWWCGARGHSAPYPGGTAHDPAMRRAPGGRMPWSPGPAPARGRHLAS